MKNTSILIQVCEPNVIPPLEVHVALKLHSISSTLPRLLRTNQSNDPTQLARLLILILLRLLVDLLSLAKLVTDLEHARLQIQHLAQKVVQEGRREGHVAFSGCAKADVQLARSLFTRCCISLLERGRSIRLSRSKGRELVRTYSGEG